MQFLPASLAFLSAHHTYLHDCNDIPVAGHAVEAAKARHHGKPLTRVKQSPVFGRLRRSAGYDPGVAMGTGEMGKSGVRWFRRPLALRWYLAGLVAGILIPAIALFGAAILMIDQQERLLTEQRLLQSAQDLADRLTREMNGHIRALSVLAKTIELDGSDLGHFHVEAQRASRTHTAWSTVALFTPDGTRLLSTRVPWGQPITSPIETSSIAEVVRTQQPTLGRLIHDGSQWSFAVRVPVMRDGQVKYVLSAWIPASSLEGMVAVRSSFGEWTRTITDQTGTIAAHTRQAGQLIGKRPPAEHIQRMVGGSESLTRSVSVDGSDVFWAASVSQPYGWIAQVSVPAEAVVGATRRSIVLIGAAGLFLLVAGLAASILLAHRFARGIRAAALGAERLAHGQRPDVPASGVRELCALAGSLERSADLLDTKSRESRDHLARADAARGEAEAARADAEEANRSKDRFLAMLGHELRNPLGPVRNGVYALRHLVAGSPRTDKILAMMDRQVEHIVRMVDDLLDVSRISRGKITLQREVFDLRALTTQVLEDFRAQSDDPGPEFRLMLPKEPVVIRADKTRLFQCMQNLLTNAVKFTPARGRITLSVEARDGQAIIEVTDTGAGIDPGSLPRLFEAFAQGPQEPSRSKGGLGLGLSLVKGWVEAHGGTVSGHSQGAGTGTRFVVTLPLDNSGVDHEMAGHASKLASIHRILVVEDNPDALESMAIALELRGHDVRKATDAAAAMRICAGYVPTLVLCDIGLPEMDGYELCQRLRALPALAETLFVAITGYGQQEDVRRAYAAGFAVHLTKPVAPEVLDNVLTLALGEPPEPTVVPLFPAYSSEAVRGAGR